VLDNLDNFQNLELQLIAIISQSLRGDMNRDIKENVMGFGIFAPSRTLLAFLKGPFILEQLRRGRSIYRQEIICIRQGLLG